MNLPNVDRATLLYAVQRKIFCAVSGIVLDVRTAVLVTITTPNGATASEAYAPDVWTGPTGDAIRGVAAARNWTVEVIDGRVVNGRKSRVGA